MSMRKWGREIQVVLGVLTTIFVAVGLYLMEKIPNMGLFFIVLSVLSFVLLVASLVKGRRRYGVEELGSEMEGMSADIADFVDERSRVNPICGFFANKHNWDGEEGRRRLTEYKSENIRIYERRFGGKVKYLVKEAGKCGYVDTELNSFYEHPADLLAVRMLSDRMRALALRMKKEAR